MQLTERPAAPQPARTRSAARFDILPAGDPARAAVEAFIAAIYALQYGAHVRTFAPTLVALRDGDDIVAAAGYRSARTPLFLERYLDRPVDAAIAAAAGARVERAAIAEVGHFSSARPGEGRQLMRRLGRHLAAGGYRWVVSTATQELRAIFARLGIRPIVLAPADPHALGGDAAHWGTYYEHAPMVLAGEILPNLMQFDPQARA